MRGYEIIARLADSYEGKVDLPSDEWHVLMDRIGAAIDLLDLNPADGEGPGGTMLLALRLGVIEE